MAEEKKNTYITLHKNFVRTDIEYLDPKSGEKRTFNSATLPKGTVIEGRDVSYYQFSPMFVNPSKYRGEKFVDIPLLTHKEVWLQRSILDAEGRPVIDEHTGRPAKDTVKVTPAQIKTALDEARKDYLAQRESKEQSLGARAEHAREGASALSGGSVPFEKPAR